MMGKIERAIEWALWQSRFMVFLAAVSSLFAALVLIIVGTYDVGMVVYDLAHAFSDRAAYEAFHKEALAGIIGAVDSYLIATVLLIFGLGLYELFISKIDLAENDPRGSKVLVIHTLDQLKENLGKVIVMVLIVVFFKNAVNFHYQEMMELFILGGGTLCLALALWLMGKGHSK